MGVRRTRVRPSARPIEVKTVAAATTESQGIVDTEVDRLIAGVIEVDAAIALQIIEATDPEARLSRIISQVAKSGRIRKGGVDLLAALDELRFAIAPGLRPASEAILDELFPRVSVGNGVSADVVGEIIDKIWG
jgi:hypothetical protein